MEGQVQRPGRQPAKGVQGAQGQVCPAGEDVQRGADGHPPGEPVGVRPQRQPPWTGLAYANQPLYIRCAIRSQTIFGRRVPTCTIFDPR